MLKREDVHFVPWADHSEWKDVREKILSRNVDDVIRAYEIMTMWRLKSNNLPAYIECTTGLLQVMIQEHFIAASNTTDVLPSFNDYDLRLSYSMALIRFVNHVHDVSEFKNNSLYSSAKTQNIPDWIITMRHDAAHGKDLPALETFRLAVKISLDWLLKNYWFQEELSTSDLKSYDTGLSAAHLNLKLLPVHKSALDVLEVCFMSNATFVTELDEDSFSHVEKLLSVCVSNDYVSNNEMHYIHFFEDVIKCQKTCGNEKYKVKDLTSKVMNLIKCLAVDDVTKCTLVQAVLQSGFMSDANPQKWKNIIWSIQSLKCLPILLRALFHLAATDNDTALDILNQLYPSIKYLRTKWPSYYARLAKGKQRGRPLREVRRRAIDSYVKKWKTLSLPLLLHKPPKIDLDMLHDLLTSPTNESKGLIHKYLPLVEPPLLDAFITDINDLIEIYCAGGKKVSAASFSPSGAASGKIYTVDDLQFEFRKELELVKPFVEGKESPGVSSEHRTTWVRSELGSEIWSSCPIGLLPSQKNVMCDLPKDVKWTRQQGERNGQGTVLARQSKEMDALRRIL